jgi:hypothetical protein
MTKILYSPGFGAGWLTWNSSTSSEFQKWMLTYQPLIDALERGEKLIPDELRFRMKDEPEQYHPALQQFIREAKEKFGEYNVYIGGANGLKVGEVSGPFRIDEYDGYESIIEASNETWISI